MYIHPAGYRVILVFLAILVLLAVLIHQISGMPMWLEWGLRGAFLILFCLVLWFFRIPPRPLTAGPNEVTAVSDGKVVLVELEAVEVAETIQVHLRVVQQVQMVVFARLQEFVIIQRLVPEVKVASEEMVEMEAQDNLAHQVIQFIWSLMVFSQILQQVFRIPLRLLWNIQ